MIYPISALRAMALYTQGLSKPERGTGGFTPDAIVELARGLGYVQIDTLQVVNRAHYVALWSRCGSYNLDDFDRLIYRAGERRLYEGWGHAASIMPLEDYRFHTWRTEAKISYNPSFGEWAGKKGNGELVEQTLARIRAEGGLRVGDFEHDGSQKGAWYDWKPSKMALEALFAWGELMVAERVNFQRVYELRERVLPGWVDTTPVDADEGRRFCLEQAAKALGVFEPRHLTLYAYMRATPAGAIVQALIEDGTLIEIRGESLAGVKTWMVHRDNLTLLQGAADGEVKAERTTFLSPFDSLFWAWGRDEKLWGFKQVLECYKPEKERVYGYFCLPILHKERLVGRFDPKLERQAGVLSLKALYLEEGIEPDDELVADVAAALRDFIAWHGAKSVRIEKSEPAVFGEKMMRELGASG
jgi:hypothetical protein